MVQYKPDGRARVGHLAQPDPAPADYNDDLGDEFFAEVDKHADQEKLSSGKTIRSFDWTK